MAEVSIALMASFLSKPWISYSRSKDLAEHAAHDNHREAMQVVAFRSRCSGVQVPILHKIKS